MNQPQNASAMVRLREMILRGELVAGEHVGEATLAELIGTTPALLRPALLALAHEGVLAELGGRGFVIRSSSEDEIHDVLDLRGAVEGVAARRIAEQGPTARFVAELRDCLRDGDRIFQRRTLTSRDKETYAEMNQRFHALILQEAASATLTDALERNARKPFASPGAIAFEDPDMVRAYDILRYAHRQHHAILDAIGNGQGARADALMREHVGPAKESLGIRRVRRSDTTEIRPSATLHETARGRSLQSS
jgi:GntR family transcriptional regulator, vanillate catabolism transcriptional regulator